MTRSSFSNPSGLDEVSANYSTAYDMALLMAYALNNDTFRKIIATKFYSSETKNKNMLYFKNKHKLVQQLSYVTGGKTGFTVNARRTLVTSAKKDNMELIVVTFNCGGDWSVHQNLFDYGYQNYKMFTALRSQIIKVNDYLYRVTPIIMQDVKYPVKNDETVTTVIHLLKKPLDKTVIGKVYLYVNGVKVHSVDIYRYY
jgi:D-alanyl-D-alanine carboxypeptidase